MNDKIPANFLPYQKKITPYLDGTLSTQDRSEFEAFVSTHPEFEVYIRNKQDEINLVKSLIPSVFIEQDVLDSLDNEIRQSVFNLLKEEPKNAWENFSMKLEDWLTR